jgi:cyanophycinase-like exopeptidase
VVDVHTPERQRLSRLLASLAGEARKLAADVFVATN